LTYYGTNQANLSSNYPSYVVTGLGTTTNVYLPYWLSDSEESCWSKIKKCPLLCADTEKGTARKITRASSAFFMWLEATTRDPLFDVADAVAQAHKRNSTRHDST